MNFFVPAEGAYPQNYKADQSRLQISELQFGKSPHTVNILVLEDKNQNPSKFMFQFFLRGNVKDQRSGDGRFAGRFFKIKNAQFRVILISQTLRCWMRGLRPL